MASACPVTITVTNPTIAGSYFVTSHPSMGTIDLDTGPICWANLTPAQEADHLKRRAELWEARNKSATNCRTLTGRGNTGFASETAAATGRDKRTIQRAINRAENIEPDVMGAVQGTE